MGAAAALETGQGHIHHAVQRLGDGGQGLVFAEGNEVVLGVERNVVGAVGVVIAQVDYGVQVACALLVVLGNTHGERTAVALGFVGKLVEDAGIVFLQVLPHHGNGGFGQDGDISMTVGYLLVVALHGLVQIGGIPFQSLRYIALHQCHGGAAAIRLGETLLAQPPAADDDTDKQHKRQYPPLPALVVQHQHQPRAAKGTQQGKQVHPAHRSIAGQRGKVSHLAVAQCTPAEAGNRPLAGKFSQRPQYGQ